MKSVQGVVAVHDLHVWRIASGMTTLSCHVSIDEVTAAVNARILNELNSVLEQKYQISHATLQLECRVHSAGCCTNKLLYCQLEQLHEHKHEHDHDHDEAHTHSLH